MQHRRNYIFLTLFALIFSGFTQLNFAQQRNIGRFITPQMGQRDFSTVEIRGVDQVTTVKFKDKDDNILREYAGTFNGDFNGNSAKFYCIDLYTNWITNSPYKFDGNTPSEISYILNNYYPYKDNYSGKLSQDKNEAAAVQMAIWHFSDGAKIQESSISAYQTLLDRASEIIDDADSNAAGYSAPSTIVISPANQSLQNGETATFVVGIYDIDGNPVSGVDVSLQTTAGQLNKSHDSSGNDGKFTFTLDGNGASSATISASASTLIPQGSRFVWTGGANKHQKLVLATPVEATAEASANVSWHSGNTNGDCDVEGYTTFTQGGWGSPSNSTPGQIRDAHFDDVFPNGMIVGDENGHFIKINSSQAVEDFLPQGGSPSELNEDDEDPTNNITVLAGQVAAMNLSVRYNEEGYLGSNSSLMKDLIIENGDFAGMKVSDFLTLANTALGGGDTEGHSLSEINDAIKEFNENFDDGENDNGFLTCDNSVTCSDNKIGNFVWHDKNVNGIQDTDEEGIEGVVVQLINENSNVIYTETTDENGAYLFSPVLDGTYKIKIADENFEEDGVLHSDAATKWYSSTKNVGNDSEKDSDGDENHEASSTVQCNDDLAIDFGFYKSSVNIVKSAPASVVAGSTIEYTFTITNTGDLTLKGGVSVYDALLRTDGDHRINHKTPVIPGEVWTFTDTYQTDVNDCGDLENIVKAIGHPVLPSGESLPVVTHYDTVVTNVDCSAPGKLGDKVWDDANKNGIQDNGELGVKDVTVKLNDCSGNNIKSTTTNASGNYFFDNLAPGDYSLEFVLPSGYLFTLNDQGNDDAVDSDANPTDGKTTCTTIDPGETDLTWDAGIYVPEPEKASIGDKVWFDTNKDGKQDNDENGIKDVVVKLYDCSNNPKGQTTTDEHGNYSFTELLPGDYYVEFVLPSGLIFTSMDNAGDDLKDSDADLSTGKTTCTTLEPGENDNSWDAGMYKPSSSIGDKVWFDTNKDGIQDGSESGIENITVKLYDCSDVFVAEALTDQNGNYLFTDLDAGDYYVAFDIPSQYSISPQNATDDDNDSDIDADGKTACSTLAVDTDDLSFDAGIYIGYASIGNKVWKDTNEDGIQDGNEDGFENVTVKLFTCDGDLVGTTHTDADGLYSFTQVVPGSYKLEFVAPSGYVFATQNAGTNDEVDSDVNGAGETDCIELVEDQTDNSWDAGLHAPHLFADLSIEKTASNMNPADGDQVTYTLTVTNHGPNDADDIVVADPLGDGLVYNGSNPSGVYDPNTGLWNVGSLSNGSVTSLTIDATVNATQCDESSFDLGVAKDFNLFVWQDFKAPSSDVQGTAAVGRDAELSNYSIADQLNSSYSNKDVFIVGRDLYFTSGRVYFGNAVYGRSSNLPKDNVSVDGTLRKESNVIDFNAAKAALMSLSGTLANYQAVDAEYKWDGVFLKGNNPLTNVFNVDGSELTKSTYMDINVPNGSVVLVNVKGNNINWSGGLDVTGTDKSNILYNFYQATKLSIHDIEVLGSVLAPKAEVHFASGLLSGQLIAKSMTGTGQINNDMFGGNIPCATEIVNVAEITESNLDDPILANNTDDVKINVDINLDPAGDPQNNNDDWVATGNNTGITDFIWTMESDKDGNMYAGTWGGKLYKTTDGQTWNVINEGMNVAFIWSIAVDNSNGKIWVATEQGAFISRDNGANWELRGLAGIDVRSIVVAGTDHVYAGTWGAGVYELSSSTSYKFVELNDGLDIKAVHALVVNGDGDLFAGTFGGGVYKIGATETSWQKTDSPSDHIWTLGITSGGDIFAGTYGNGVLVTYDNGLNWTEMNDNLPGQYIYSIVVDNDDNVYVSSWSAGVHMLPGNTPTSPKAGGNDKLLSVSWTNVGMGGFNVSTLLVNETTGDIYAGTENGTIYKKESAVTAISDNELVPTKFSMSQNYPNPFNPSTVIKFSIAKAGSFTLKIYSILGEEVATLMAKDLNPGSYNVNFDASKLSSGIYVYQLVGENVKFTKKMMLLK